MRQRAQEGPHFTEVATHVRRFLATSTAMVALAACGGASSSTAAPPRSQSTASAAGSGPCRTVTDTTPIQLVPNACAALWTPYGVTAVPPGNVIQQENIPPAPQVTNKTGGAVSDADAQAWAAANSRTGAWYRWAEANDQPALLPHVIAGTLVSATEQQLLAQGARIDQPDCALFPLTVSVYPIQDDGRAYFAKKNVTVTDQWALVISYPGPCVATVTYADGHTSSLQELPGPGMAFGPGVLKHDPVLGDIWYADAAGSCTDPAAPAEWCGH